MGRTKKVVENQTELIDTSKLNWVDKTGAGTEITEEAKTEEAVAPVKRRGRPKKIVDNVEKSENTEAAPVKRRGRPRKNVDGNECDSTPKTVTRPVVKKEQYKGIDAFGVNSVVKSVHRDNCMENHLLESGDTVEFDFKSIKDTRLRSKARKLVGLIEDDDSYELSVKIWECVDAILAEDKIITNQKLLEKKD